MGKGAGRGSWDPGNVSCSARLPHPGRVHACPWAPGASPGGAGSSADTQPLAGREGASQGTVRTLAEKPRCRGAARLLAVLLVSY